jgi:hypothetical protein
MFVLNLLNFGHIVLQYKAPFKHIKSAMWTVAGRAEFANARAEEPIYLPKSNQVLRE